MTGNDMECDHYAVLQIGLRATKDDIRTAYKRLALKCHPDKDPNNVNAASVFQKEAYEVLSDPAQRILYDSKYGRTTAACTPGGSTSGDGFSRTAPQNSAETRRQAAEEAALRAKKLEVDQLQDIVVNLETEIFNHDSGEREAEELEQLKRKQNSGLWATFSSLWSAQPKQSAEEKLAAEQERLQKASWRNIKSAHLATEKSKLQLKRMQYKRMERDLQARKAKAQQEREKREQEAQWEQMKRNWKQQREQEREEAEARRKVFEQMEREREQQEREKREQEAQWEQMKRNWEQEQRREQEREEAQARRKVFERMERERKQQDEENKPKAAARDTRQSRERWDRQGRHQPAPSPHQEQGSPRSTQSSNTKPYGTTAGHSRSSSGQNNSGRVECQHLGWWPQVPGRHQCSGCRIVFHAFILECPGCHIQACANCRPRLKSNFRDRPGRGRGSSGTYG
ncbi:hypothetical protein FQN50_002750 [Emmonsiellopsis sp. PD_5]|nr:hypothetical protein FQN50_002750 [Emmonsiellopsis sp. PD_5]